MKWKLDLILTLLFILTMIPSRCDLIPSSIVVCTEIP